MNSERAGRIAAHIVNLLSADMPKHELYGKIQALLMAALIDSQAERDGIIFLPSEN